MTQEFLRADGRLVNQMRPVTITPNWIDQGEGNALISFGNTRVLCVASLTPGVPKWRKDSGLGWVTGEYAMLPRATSSRSQRESVKGKVSGPTQEISRLVGRSMRAAVDMSALGENTLVIDCDVLQADGGTRTAAITGAYVALAQAVAYGQSMGIIAADKPGRPVVQSSICAVSVGIIDGIPMLDLPYEEDVRADTDMNIVATGTGEFIEIQGTAEHAPFTIDQLHTLLDLAGQGTRYLTQRQHEILSELTQGVSA